MIDAQGIKRLAYGVGFDLCGICSPEVIPEARERYYRWLEKRYHGELAYLAKDPERRSDPRLLLDGGKSVIMLGLNYYQQNTETVPEGYGRVSRYARGRDYHKVIAKMTRELIRGIEGEMGSRRVTPRGGTQISQDVAERGVESSREARPDGTGTAGKNESVETSAARTPSGQGFRPTIDSGEEFPHTSRPREGGDPVFRWFVDYGPMLERAYAEKAGLGYVGRNGMLISRQFGSWIFLSEIITTLELAPDDPKAVKHGTCGTCRKCIEACPTQAIVEDRVVDSTKCISYLTIERPTVVDEALIPKIGERIFGCDVCQEVCPHNFQRQKLTKHEAFLSGGVGELIDTRKVLAMQTREDFLAMTSGTPLTRTKLEGLQRSAEWVRQGKSAK